MNFASDGSASRKATLLATAILAPENVQVSSWYFQASQTHSWNERSPPLPTFICVPSQAYTPSLDWGDSHSRYLIKGVWQSHE